jgi:hypothetical protein
MAFAQAPSAHMHAHESTGRHVGKFLHTHVPHAAPPASQDPEWRAYDPNEDAVFLNWSVSSPSDDEFTAVALPEARLSPPLPGLGEWRHVTLLPTAHAPPPLTSRSPRAPPV